MTSSLTRARKAAHNAVMSLAQRDIEIRRAYADGATTRAIAEAVGLSHQRVHQIVKKP